MFDFNRSVVVQFVVGHPPRQWLVAHATVAVEDVQVEMAKVKKRREMLAEDVEVVDVVVENVAVEEKVDRVEKRSQLDQHPRFCYGCTRMMADFDPSAEVCNPLTSLLYN